MQAASDQMYTVSFGLLCLSSFLFFASFNMMIPELPAYLSSMGGAEYKGLIIALFTVTAGFSRPFSGKLTDTIGRVPVMAFGSLVCFICGFLYPILTSVMGFLWLRLVHGFSTGFKPTGTSAYVADIVPASRRGEAMGILGLSGSTGMAIGPAIGSWVTEQYSLNGMFYTSSLLALLSILILMGMKETITEKIPFRWQLLNISLSDVFEPLVIGPSVVIFLTSFCFGAVLTLAPDFSVYLGVANKGLFFTCFTLSSLATRFMAGKVSDQHGRIPILKISSVCMAFSMILIGIADSSLALLVAACVFGIALGMNSPTVSAWTIDLSLEAFRGRAVATMYIALELGIGIGAFVSAVLYGNDPANFKLAFFVAGAFALAAWAYLQFIYKRQVPKAA
jgi:MFS family permease